MAKAQKKARQTTKPAATQDELLTLQAENAHLKQEITQLKTKKSTKKRTHSFWFSFFAGISAVIAVTTFMLFNLSYWTQQTIVDNKKFTAAVSPIIQNQDVQKALQTEISKQIFARINVEQELQKVLPENLQFIAAPLASQFQSFATGKIGDALQSPQVQQAWTTTLSTVQGKLMAYIQNPQNDGKITVDDIYKTVGDQLSSSQIGFLFGKNLPSSIGSVTVKEVTWLPKARQYLNLLDKLTKELAIATVVFAIAAIALARRRVNMVIGLIVFSSLFMLATLAAIKTGYLQVDGIVKNNDYDAAAKAIYSIVTNSLVAQTQGFLALFGSCLTVLIVVSPLDWVVWLRKKFRAGLDWVTAKLPFSFASPSWLHWASANKAVIAWTLTAVMYVGFALRLPPTVSGVVTALVASFIAVIILEITASVERTCGHNNS